MSSTLTLALTLTLTLTVTLTLPDTRYDREAQAQLVSLGSFGGGMVTREMAGVMDMMEAPESF